MVHVFRGLNLSLVTSKAETLWQKDVVEGNCLAHGSWEAEQDNSAIEQREGPDVDTNVMSS